MAKKEEVEDAMDFTLDTEEVQNVQQMQ